MRAATLEKWVWVLLYGGLLTVGLGLAVRRNDAAVGFGMAVVGGIVAAVGVVLIYVRSRIHDPARDPAPKAKP